MLRCTSSFVIAAYEKVRLIPQDSRALPAAFLRSRPIFATFKTFHRVDHLSRLGADRSRAENVFDRLLQSPYQPTGQKGSAKPLQTAAGAGQRRPIIKTSV
jgi:hypothetical protein